LTPEIVGMWNTLCEIKAAGDDREWEPLGRHREFMKLNCDLCTALGGWWGTMIFPIDVTSPEPRDYMLHSPIQTGAWRLRRRLLALRVDEIGGRPWTRSKLSRCPNRVEQEAAKELRRT
jgi:hypothetical protein